MQAILNSDIKEEELDFDVVADRILADISRLEAQMLSNRIQYEQIKADTERLLDENRHLIQAIVFMP